MGRTILLSFKGRYPVAVVMSLTKDVCFLLFLEMDDVAIHKDVCEENEALKAWWCSKIWYNPMPAYLKMAYTMKNLPFWKCLLPTGLWGTSLPDKTIYFLLNQPYPTIDPRSTHHRCRKKKKKHVGSVFDELRKQRRYRYMVSWGVNILGPFWWIAILLKFMCIGVLYLRLGMLCSCTASIMGPLSFISV